MKNKIKEKLINNELVIGTFVNIPSPMVAEVIGLSGFDFILIDFEHASFNYHIAENMIRGANNSSCSVIIRTADKNPNNISKALDIGAEAVQVPQVCSKEDAQKIVDAGKFYPLGNRGMSHYVRAASYSHIEKARYYNNENENNLIIIQIEGQNAILELDKILEINGIDVIFIGPFDLSQSLGVPGQVNHPLVEEKIFEITNKAKKADKWIGTYVEDLESFEKNVKQGVKLLTHIVDVKFLYDACVEDVNKLRNIEKRM